MGFEFFTENPIARKGREIGRKRRAEQQEDVLFKTTVAQEMAKQRPAMVRSVAKKVAKKKLSEQAQKIERRYTQPTGVFATLGQIGEGMGNARKVAQESGLTDIGAGLFGDSTPMIGLPQDMGFGMAPTKRRGKRASQKQDDSFW